MHETGQSRFVLCSKALQSQHTILNQLFIWMSRATIDTVMVCTYHFRIIMYSLVCLVRKRHTKPYNTIQYNGIHSSTYVHAHTYTDIRVDHMGIKVFKFNWFRGLRSNCIISRKECQNWLWCKWSTLKYIMYRSSNEECTQ